MGLHPRERMKKNFDWMERKRREKGRNPNPNKNPFKGARRNIFQKTNASIVMNSGTIARSFLTRRKERRNQ